ncbi:inositol monophosphatase family protein [Planctomycetota bacterium]
MIDPAQLEAMLKTSIGAARQAGDYALRHVSEARISIKSGTTGEELVTQIDKRCQEIIIDIIHERYPDHGFIGEEGELGKIFKRPPADPDSVWWVIDPIDGTNNFARGLEIFAVSIGAMHQGRPVAGVIYCPSMDALFTGIQNGAALLNGQPIEASTDEISHFTSVGLDGHQGETMPSWFVTLMKRSRFRNLGSAALHIAYVANGAMVATVIGLPKLWDIAAGAIIAERAGARITNWQGEDLWPMNLEDYQGEKICCIVANAKAHPEIVALTRESTN